MKHITNESANAFYSKTPFKKQNMQVLFKAQLRNGKFPKGDNFIVMELHGNEIAAMDSGNNDLYITNAGWQTNTTKERLNGLPNVSIQQKKGKWYLNGKEWNGEWIAVK